MAAMVSTIVNMGCPLTRFEVWNVLGGVIPGRAEREPGIHTPRQDRPLIFRL